MMTALIIENINQFPIPCSSGGIWMPTNNTVSGDYWLQLEAKDDCEAHNIEFHIGEIEIKQEEIE